LGGNHPVTDPVKYALLLQLVPQFGFDGADTSPQPDSSVPILGLIAVAFPDIGMIVANPSV